MSNKMKSQAKLLLEKMNSQIQIKHNSKPSTHFKKMVLIFHWSMTINKLQKIMLKRCDPSLQILKQLQEQPISHSKSEQVSLILKKNTTKHIRYLSNQNSQNDKFYTKDDSIIIESNEEPISSQRQLNTPRRGCYVQGVNFTTKQYSLKESAYFQTQNSLDKLKFNEEFLELFDKGKQISKFGQLSDDKIKEQEQLIKKIIDSRTSKPSSDLKTFLSLIKKPQIEIVEQKPQQQQQSFLILIVFIMLITLVIIHFKFNYYYQ